MTMANRVQRRGRRAQSGFTLIELLVVIAILGVLAGIVVFNVAGVTNRGSKAACDTDIGTVQAAVETYRNTPTTATPAGSANASTGAPGPGPASGGVVDFTKLVPGFLHTTPSACAAYNIDGNGTVTPTYK
jgi:prepilin-type N-terminal cleavage/methylation domain-containing protein